MHQQKNKIKAAILLIVFALNTAVSFACSVGFRFDFNRGHHKHTAAHSNDKVHSHVEVSHEHQHIHEGDHHHSKTDATTSGDEEKNCCSDEVVKLGNFDKALASSTNESSLPLPLDVIAAIDTYLLPGYYKAEILVKPKSPFDRSWNPTTHINIRIAIQSFQI